MENQVLSSPKEFFEVMEDKINHRNSDSNSSNDDLQFIGKTIFLVRQEQKLNLTELSLKTKIPISILSRYENSILIPNYKKLRQICQGMGVDFLVFMIKCINEEKIQDDRKRLTIEEYEPSVKKILEETQKNAYKSFLDLETVN